MSDIPQEPPEEVLQAFDARRVAPLGGRLNRHWRVEVGCSTFVLRCWAQAADEVVYEVHLLKRLAAKGWPVAPVVGEVILFDGRL